MSRAIVSKCAQCANDLIPQRRRAPTSHLFKQVLHLLEEGFFLRGFLVVPEFREFLVEFLLFAAQVLRDFHADVHVEASTVTALVQRVQALFAQAQDAPGLSAGRNLDLHFATVQRRDSLRSAKHQLVDRHLDFAVQIVAFAGVEVVGLFGNDRQQVAAGTAARPAVAFATQVQVLALGNARRNLDGDFFRFLHTALAAATATRVRDDFAHAVTGGAGAFGNHLEEPARYAAHAPRTLTGFTSLDVGAALAVTFRTRRVAFQANLLGAALEDFLVAERHLDLQVVSAGRTGLASTATTATAAKAESATENIAELRENVVEVETCTAKSAATKTATGGVKAELVILLTLLGVAEHVVGLGSLLELLFGFLVARVLVRVVLDGKLLVGVLDLVSTRVLADA